MATDGLQYLSAFLLDETTRELAPLDFFNSEIEQRPAAFIRDFLSNHQVKPSIQVVNRECDGALPIPTDDDAPLAFYFEKVVERFKRRTLIDGLRAVEEKLKEKDSTADQCATLLQQTAASLAVMSGRVHKATDNIEAVFEAHDELRLSSRGVVKTPWASLNDDIVAVRPKDLVSLVAPSGVGKTYLSLVVAIEAYKQYGVHTQFVSMEMDIIQIMQRVIAIHTHTPAGILTAGQVSTRHRANIKAQFADITGEYLTIVDAGMSGTVSDIAATAAAVRPDFVVVDGAYMLESDKSNSRASWADQIRNVANDLKKDIAGKLRVPVWATWQLTKTGSKAARKGKVAGQDEIAGGQAINNVSSIVIEAAPGTYVDSENQVRNSRQLAITKNRDGSAGGSSAVTYDLQRMRFDPLENHLPGLAPPPLPETKRDG